MEQREGEKHLTGRMVLKKSGALKGLRAVSKMIGRLRYKGGVGTSSDILQEEGCVLESHQGKTFSVLETERGSHARLTLYH